jgi:hypothetical protein
MRERRHLNRTLNSCANPKWKIHSIVWVTVEYGLELIEPKIWSKSEMPTNDKVGPLTRQRHLKTPSERRMM